jgi:DNA-binding NtrC family response regulator
MKKHNVLVVDDDAHILEVLEMRLTALGFAVTTTDSPEEALRSIAARASTWRSSTSAWSRSTGSHSCARRMSTRRACRSSS